MTTLGELGLSSYEEKAYRTLLVTVTVTAAELSTASGVPRGRIYDVLNGLESRALVRTQSGDPKRYAPVDPETVVDRLLAERTAELEREWERYREVAETVRSDLVPSPPAESSFWLGSLGSDEMCAALRRHARTAEEYVHAAVGPPYENATWEAMRSEFEAFFDGTSEGVSVEPLVSEDVLDVLPDTLPQLLPEESTAVSIGTLPDIGLSFDVVDREVTTVDIPHPSAADERLGVVGSNDPRIVEEFDRQFQRLRATADPLLE